MSPGVPMDRAAIEACLPHREPFLFLDRVLSLSSDPGDVRLTAEWRVPESADFFRGHYPGNPVTPGVILCEHAFQAGAMLLGARGTAFGATRDVPVVARIERAKFRRMVRPGETLTTEVRLIDTVGPAHYLDARVRVGSAAAVELACVLMRTTPEETT